MTQIVQYVAGELPVISYFLCDSWYTSAKIMEAFIKIYTIGELKANQILYLGGMGGT